MTIVWPVIVSVLRIVTAVSAQSSLSAGFRRDSQSGHGKTWGVVPKRWAAECPPDARPGGRPSGGFLAYACLVPLVGRTDTRGDQHDAADDVAKCRVVIDAGDAPYVIGALPAHPPFPDPSR